MTYEDLLEYLSKRPRTTKELVQHFHMDNIDMKNRLQALKNKGQAWVLNIEPLWFAKGFKLRKGATNEEIREYALAMWYVFDVDKQNALRRAKVVFDRINEAVGNEESDNND